MSSPWDVESLEGRMMLSAVLQNDPTYVAFEAETPIVAAPATSWGVVNSYPTGTLAGNAGLRALGTTGAAGTVSFPVNFTTGGTYRLYVRGAYSSAGDNSLLVPPSGGSTSGTPSAVFDDQTNAIGKTQWHTTGTNSNFTYTVTPGTNTLNIAPRESGYVIDRIILSTNQSLTPAQLDAMSDSPITLDTPSMNISPADQSVTLSWTPVPGAATYTIKRDGTTVASNITNPYFTDLGLTNGVSHGYTITAFNGTNSSPESFASFATPADSGFVPGSPSATAVGTSKGIELTWFPSFGATSYDVMRGTSTGQETFYKNVTDPGLIDAAAPGTTYFYTVIAKNSHGDSSSPLEVSAQAPVIGTGTGLRASFRAGTGNRDFSGPVAFSEIDTPDKNFFNGAPLFNPATFGADNFSARWIGQVQAQITDTYTLYITVDDGGRLFVDGAQVQLLDANGAPQDAWKDQGSTTYHWTSPTPWTAGSKHDIKVEYYENGGGADAELQWSTTLNANPVSIPTSQLYSVALTSAPTIAKTYVGNNSITLDFSSLDNATGFNLYRSTTSGSGYQLVNTGGPLPISTARYVDTGVTNGTTYYYILKGLNEFGEGPASAEVSVAPTATATPVAPTALTATTTGINQVTLNWAVVPYADTYTVKRSTTAGGPYVTIASGVTGLTYTDSNVVSDTTTHYYYVVSAQNANGSGPDSTEAGILPGVGFTRGSYFSTGGADNEPSAFGVPDVTRLDRGLGFTTIPANFNIGETQGVTTDRFSVMWTGRILIDTAGTYTIDFLSDDSGYAWVDGTLVSRDPDGHGQEEPDSAAATTRHAESGLFPITLTAGWHDLVAVMGEGGGGFGASLKWVLPGQDPAVLTNRVAVPADHLIDTMSSPAAATGLSATDAGPFVTVSFTDGSTSELGYKLQRSSDNGSTWNTITTTYQRDGSKITDLAPILNQPVLYRVVAFNYDGDGTPSSTLSFTHSSTDNPNGLVGSYFPHTQGLNHNEPNTTGSPTVVRIDPGNFNVNGGPTVPANFNGSNIGMTRASTDNFTGRWTGQVMADADGTYTFFGNSDDASYIYVDNQLVSSYPGGHGRSDVEVTTPITLTAGLHNIVLLYGEGGGGYGMSLNWTTPGGTPNVAVPTDHLFARMNFGVSDLTAVPSDTAVTLSWNSTQGDLTQTLERSTSPDFSNPTVITLPASATSYADTGLALSTTYYYRLTATNPFEANQVLTLTAATGASTAPADPTNLYARALNGDKVLVTWNDNAINETHYSLERKDVTTAGAYAQIALLNPDTVTYTDSGPGLVEGHTYSYRVIAWNENGVPTLKSNYSNESSAIVVANTLPAGWGDSDVGTVATAGSAQYDVKSGTFYLAGSGDDVWNAADAFNYAYEQMSGNFVLTARALITNGPDGWTKAGVMVRNDLSAGSQNDFMLISRDNGLSNQNRPTSGGASVNVGAAHGSAQPVWLRLVRIGDNITGFWSDDGLTYTQLGASVSVPMSQPVYVGLGLTGHHNTNDGVLANASFDNVTVTTAGAPEAPTNVRVAAVTNQDLRVSWADNSALESGYKVERATQASFSDAQLVGTEAANQTLFVDHFLNPNTTYYYRVTAFSDAGGSSATGSGTTMTTAPGVKYVGDNNPYSDFQLNGSAIANQADTSDFNNYALQLTANTGNQTSSVFSLNKVDLTNFHFGFDLQMNNGAVADGMTFAIVGDATTAAAAPNGNGQSGNMAMGGGGGSLGFNGIGKSAGLKFDLYNNINKTDLLFNGAGADGDGGIDVSPSGVQFRSGDAIHVDVYYNSSLQAMTEIITDLSSGNTFAHVYTGVDLPGVIGASTGYVGFTAATGGSSALQEIRDAEYDQTPIASTSVTGTGAAGNIYLSGTGGNTNVWINHDPTSTPADITKPTASSSFSLDAKGGTVTIDLSNGQPIVPLGLTLANVGTLRVIGGTGADTLVGANGNMVLDGSNGLIYTGNAIGGIQFVGNGGADSLSFTGGNYSLVSDPGAGGTLATLRVSNDSHVNVKSAMHLQSLNVSNTGQVLFDNVRGHTLVLANDLNLTDSAVVDLNDNDMVISTNAGPSSVAPIGSLSGTVAGSPNAGAGSTPAAENVTMAIDGTTTKYLNFGNAAPAVPGDNTGFFVTPKTSATTVTGLRLFTANDSENRDPASYTFEGTNDDPASPTAVWSLISSGPLALPTARNAAGAAIDPTTMANQEVDFNNSTAYKSYRVLFPTVKGDAVTPPSQNSMQIGEVQLMTAAGPLNLALSFEQKIQRYVANGSANSAGPKLIASSANDASSQFSRTLAVANNANVQFSSFSGETFAAGDFNQLLVKYTYFGDANLDGQVTPRDYAIVDGNIGPDHDWGQGDLNGDGATTPADYAQIDGNIGAGNGTANGGPQLNAVVAPSGDSTASTAPSAPTTVASGPVLADNTTSSAPTQPTAAATTSPFSTATIHDNSDLFGSNADLLA